MKKIDKFIGDDNIDWSEHALSEALKIQNKETSDFTDKNCFDYFNKFKPDGSYFLDIGCNIGKFIPAVLANKWFYFGIDGSKTAIEIARNKHQKNDGKVRLYHINALELSKIFTNDIFDIVFTNTVLQHIHNENKEKILKHIHKILKEDGILVIQEVVDSTNIRAFDRDGWIKFITTFGFNYVTGVKDERNGFVFRKVCKV